ncbi:helix-turn-helix transcriptional regulator [Candidatus Woesearchaeota archaeon]|nr:helix-turn-helix transcriptional regulator [Candidatus Woesearchaeota archaeon]
MVGEGYCPCPLEGAAEVLSRKWTLSILVTIGNFKKLRFNNLLSKIKINPKTLTDRLKELEKMNLIKRTVYAETPLRVEYSLTKKGVSLRKATIPLMKWAIKEKN